MKFRLSRSAIAVQSLAVALSALGLSVSNLRAQSLPQQHLDLSERFRTFIHESWTSEHGLPQNVITSIAQTPDGYIWLGTQSGLVRFNSVSFKNFDRYNTPAIANEFIRRLAVADDSTLWIGTEHGGVVSMRNHSFAAQKISDQLSVEGTRVVLTGTNRMVWISIPGQGVWKRGGVQWQPVLCGRPLTSVWAAYEDIDGTVWLGERGDLIHVAGDSIRHYGMAEGMPQTQVMSLVRDSRGNLLIGTQDHGLLSLSNERVAPLSGAERLDSSYVVDLCKDSVGGVWIGCLDKGLYYYDGSTVEPCLSNPTAPPLRVTSVALDRGGDLWFGTMGDGIHRLRRSVVQYLKATEPGIFPEVWAVMPQGNRLWIGTRANGLRCLADGRIIRPPMSARLSRATVCALIDGPDGTLWIGAEDGLLTMSHGVTSEIMTPAGKPFVNVYALLKDRRNTVWIGAQNLFRSTGGKMEVIENTPAGFSVNYLLEDHKGNLWIGSDAHGVGLLAEGRISFYTTDSGLTSNTILCLCEDDAGGILAGTQGGGLNRFQNGRWGSLTTENGLLDDNVNTIIRADDGTVWMSTNKGLFGISQQSIAEVTEKKVTRVEGCAIESRDFLQSTEFAGGLQTCSAKDSNGTLWFASLKGLVGYNPRTSKRNTQPPPVYIEAIDVNGQAQQLSGVIEAGPGLRSVRFGYVGLSYIVPDATHYEYRLEGIDAEWINGGKAREATYANLPPGSYVFRVKAAHGDGLWSREPASVQIVLRPWFWQTDFFKALAMLSIAGLFFLAYQLRVRRILGREAELKRRVDEAVANIKMLRGLIPICANCKKIRDDRGYWNRLEAYLRDHSEAVLSHGICPECAEKLYPEELSQIRERKAREKNGGRPPEPPAQEKS